MFSVAAEVRLLARIPSPVSGLLTVTVKVIVAVAPGARFPVQVRFGLEKTADPLLAVASLL